MFSDRPFFAYAFLNREHYESLDHYVPGNGYSDLVRELAPAWELSVRGFWTNCVPQGFEFLYQGWKIHLSAVPRIAEEVLHKTVPILTERGIAFKFASDEVMLRLALSKNWSRAGAGKFMTAYPRSVKEFLETLEALHAATSGLRGPYILSDRPYRDSSIVFYRYGEHVSRRRTDSQGLSTPLLEAPDGSRHPDLRTGYFLLPPWTEDPVSAVAPLKPPDENGVLLHDRYRVKVALRFGATGGIYTAVDTTNGEEVVVREARPLTGTVSDDTDSFELLRREARILQRLAHTGILPRFVDLFQEWEHLFLVQERIEAQSLWGHAINFFFGHPEESPHESFTRFRDTALKLIRALRTVHEHGVVLRDLTRNNTLITPEEEVRFIDLEFAHELGSGQEFLWVQTPGYASPEQLRAQAPTVQDDHYSLGALLLDILTFNAAGLDLNREGILASLDVALRDLRLPTALGQLVRGLLSPDLGERWDLDRAESFLKSIAAPDDHRPLFHQSSRVPDGLRASRDLRGELRDTVEGMCRYIHSKTRLAREDALWPGAAEMFMTNPVNLQFGAAGTALFLLRAEGRVPEAVLDWIAQRTKTALCPPGLARGVAGVALLLLQAGRTDQALEMLDYAAQSPILEDEKGLYFGLAGWGMVQLHAWHRCGLERHLAEAVRVGEVLVQTARELPEGVTWSNHPERSNHGLIDGPSGIALFLLHLAAVTGERRAIDLARRGLEFDLAHRREVGKLLLWYPYTDAPASEPQSPHLWFGTAGIGPVLLRAHALTGDPELLEWAERCAASVSDRYTNKLWHDFGLAGFGELMLDFYALQGDPKYLSAASYLAEALLAHRMEREDGFAFLGQEHGRICCDFGGGMAGIGLFFQRILEPGLSRPLMLDELFRPRLAHVAGAAAMAEAIPA